MVMKKDLEEKYQFSKHQQKQIGYFQIQEQQAGPQLEIDIMYLEKSQNLSGSENVFVSFESTDIFQFFIISFCYKRFSILTKDSKRSM